jgi:hypothetical protein
MRSMAHVHDPAGILIDRRENIGFLDCHFIETKQGHLWSTDYRELNCPEKQPWE